MLIKVCGMREADNIRAVESLGIDLMGFIFWPKSSRFVAELPSYLPRTVKRVGVFVDADIDEICRNAADFDLDYVQLHGHESPEYFHALRSLCGNSIGTIKAFPIATPADLAATAPYEDLADFFLFDTRAQLPGGNGEKFDWSILSAYTGTTPFFLSGGIGPNDATAVNTFFRAGGSIASKCVGIDLNSRFELSPALKDTEALRRFLSQLSHDLYSSH